MRKAVILAAGSGTRLGKPAPKGLTPVAGRPLLAWIGASLAAVGIREVFVVVNAELPELAQAVRMLAPTLEVKLAQCTDWQLGNGRSAAFAQRLIGDERFFLLMSDHLVGADHLRLVADAPADICQLGTCAPAPWIDIGDATKIRADEAGRIHDIGKELTSFNGIDTGVFAMTSAIFPALEEARLAGEYSLTAGNRRLCRDGLLGAAPIRDLRWYDIDTPTDLAAADAWLQRENR